MTVGSLRACPHLAFHPAGYPHYPPLGRGPMGGGGGLVADNTTMKPLALDSGIHGTSTS